MFAEHGLVETSQIVTWALACIAAVCVLARHPHPRDRCFAGWLCVVGALAMLREMDAHIYLNPGSLGGWGVRYRIDWWLDRGSPVLPRVAWLALAVLIGLALVVPFLRVAPKFVWLLRARDRATVLFALGCLALLAGYSFDDLFGRGQFFPAEHTMIAEELLELAGASLFALSVLCLLLRPLTTREARALSTRAKAPALPAEAGSGSPG